MLKIGLIFSNKKNKITLKKIITIYKQVGKKHRKTFKPHELNAFKKVSKRLKSWQKAGIIISVKDYIKGMYRIYKKSDKIKSFTPNFLIAEEAWEWLLGGVNPEDLEVIVGISPNTEYQKVLDELITTHNSTETEILQIFPEIFSKQFIKFKQGDKSNG